MRQTLEQQEREAFTRGLDEDDEQWERRKQRDKELRDRKRGRGAEMMVESGATIHQGERKKLKIRRLKHKILEEGWGEEDDCQESLEPPPVVLPPPPVIRRGEGKSSLTHLLTSSVISNYRLFSPSPRDTEWTGGTARPGLMRMTSCPVLRNTWRRV